MQVFCLEQFHLKFPGIREARTSVKFSSWKSLIFSNIFWCCFVFPQLFTWTTLFQCDNVIIHFTFIKQSFLEINVLEMKVKPGYKHLFSIFPPTLIIHELPEYPCFRNFLTKQYCLVLSLTELNNSVVHPSVIIMIGNRYTTYIYK